jgi:hypothetical protein
VISGQRSIRIRLPDGDVAAAHAVYGDGVSRVVSRPAFVGAALVGSRGVAHGVNASGLLAGGVGSDAEANDFAATVVHDLLEQATSLDDARALASERLAGIAPLQVELWLAQGDGAITLSATGDIDTRTDPHAEEHAAGMDALLSAVRQHGPGGPGGGDASWCRHGTGARTVSVVAARLGAVRPSATLLSPGPPCCGVFVRYWPGVEVGPDAGGTTTQPPRVAQLTSELGAIVAADPSRLAAVRRGLATAEVAALAEGAAAERMASLMDGDGDDRGAEVRRVVAQVYALDIALRAIGEAVTEGSGLGATL